MLLSSKLNQFRCSAVAGAGMKRHLSFSKLFSKLINAFEVDAAVTAESDVTADDKCDS
jgi:hypothetical protein